MTRSLTRILAPIFSLAAAFTAAATPVAADGPALWRYGDDDTTVHILGSVHLLKPGTVWLDDELQQLISDAQRIYFEVPPEQTQPQAMQALIQKYALLPEDDHLKNHVSQETFATFEAFMAEIGAPIENFARFEPWMAGLVVTTIRSGQAGFNPAAGVEATVTSVAQARGTATGGLETAESQLLLFDELDPALQEEALVKALTDESFAEQMETLTGAWTVGDVDAIDAFMDEQFRDYPELETKLLDQRNAAWVPQLTALLDKPGAYFVVVGTAHLTGEGSVVDLLDKKGVTVERIN